MYKLAAMYYFMQDETTITVDRRALTFIDVIQKVGGMLGVVSTLFTIFAKRIQKTLFLNDLLSSSVFKEDYNVKE